MNDPDFLGQLYTLDALGYPVRTADGVAWAKWFQRPENRRLLNTHLMNGMEVSTIFLGVDRGDGLLFESVVWHGDQVITDEFYDSRADALLGHDRLCERANNMRAS